MDSLRSVSSDLVYRLELQLHIRQRSGVQYSIKCQNLWYKQRYLGMETVNFVLYFISDILSHEDVSELYWWDYLACTPKHLLLWFLRTCEGMRKRKNEYGQSNLWAGLKVKLYTFEAVCIARADSHSTVIWSDSCKGYYKVLWDDCLGLVDMCAFLWNNEAGQL